MKLIEPKLNNGKKFLFGDRLTIADFWIAGVYVNWASNPNIAYGKEQWAEFLKTNPSFVRYGERFKAENLKYISKR